MFDDLRTFRLLPRRHCEVFLPQGTIARLEHARGLGLRVARGSVWITEYGRTEDIILEPGDIVRIVDDGVVLVSACARHRYAVLVVERNATAARPAVRRVLERVAACLKWPRMRLARAARVEPLPRRAVERLWRQERP